jgi:hypothetical protein
MTRLSFQETPMSMTLWLHTLHDRDMSRESDDHTLMHELSDQLDALCERLGVARLSSFFDLTDMEYNYADRVAGKEGDPQGNEDDDGSISTLDPETGYAYGIDDMQWFDASTGLIALQALYDEIASTGGLELHLTEEEHDVLLDEIEDCIVQLKETAAQRGRFHLAVLM